METLLIFDADIDIRFFIRPEIKMVIFVILAVFIFVKIILVVVFVIGKWAVGRIFAFKVFFERIIIVMIKGVIKHAYYLIFGVRIINVRIVGAKKGGHSLPTECVKAIALEVEDLI